MIHAKLTGINPLGSANVRERTIMTTCVSGSAAIAKYCRDTGRSESGKKVPLKRNMGVMNRNVG